MPKLVRFDNSLTRWKRTIFKICKNSQFAKFAKFRMKTQFFPRQAIPKIFLLYTSLHWWYSIPNLVWFGQLLDPMKKNFFKFSNIRNSRNSQNSVWKTNFFLGKLYQKFFMPYTFITLVILLADFGLIWTTPWPNEKDLFLKFLFREIQSSVWKTNFFPRQVIPKILFVLTAH